LETDVGDGGNRGISFTEFFRKLICNYVTHKLPLPMFYNVNLLNPKHEFHILNLGLCFLFVD
jgi:hypothetical protein